jgi:hypothetical protein
LIKHLYSVFAGIFLFGALTFSKAHAQTVIDSTGLPIDSVTKAEAAIDSVQNQHSPRKASLRSAVLPGWGQAYNKRYWKIPVVYAALGTTAYIFVYNVKTYRELRFAYAARFKAQTFQDSVDYFKLKPLYQNPDVQINSIKFNRDEFRRNVDYSVLVFAVIWALNIVDATVDAHLKSFDVSSDLGLRFKAGYSDIARTNGFSVVLSFK